MRLHKIHKHYFFVKVIDNLSLLSSQYDYSDASFLAIAGIPAIWV